MFTTILGFTIIFLGVVIYAWFLNRAMNGTPPEAQKLVDAPWRKEDIRVAYEQAKKSSIDVKPFLKPKTGRRYIVVGGSGVVGSRIVQHLIWRGEDPAAIRILDLQAPTRPEGTEEDIEFFTIDVTNKSGVNAAFEAPWPTDVTNSPLTVFHCVAYIAFRERYAAFLPRYLRVNVDGTRNVINSAQAAKASIFIATASGGIGLRPPSFFIWPWQRCPKDMFQIHSVAKAREKDSLGSMANCYAYSKAKAEALVLTCHSPKNNFCTGCVRPCHAIYAENVASPSNIVWDYLRRGGTPTWLHNIIVHFVDAENVSIAHLAYEHTLLKQLDTGNQPDETAAIKGDVGGRTYFITAPNPPITYGHLYDLLTHLAHPLTPQSFPRLPPGPMFLLAQLVELYELLWTLTPFSRLFPLLAGDLAVLQPATFNVCTGHYVFDDSDARREIGYVAPIRTMEGFVRAVLAWNETVEGKMRTGEMVEGAAGKI